MAKRVYFCFHYADVANFRANVVRNHWLTKDDREQAGFFDWSIWEEARKIGSVAVKRLINREIEGSSTTCVLIGSETYRRPWVRYEAMKSFERGNEVFGVHINSIPGKDRSTKPLGPNPFLYLGVTYSASGLTQTLHEKSMNGKWVKYAEIDGCASTQVAAVDERFRGKGFNLGTWYPAYDWVADDGYHNFADWIG